jgi:hypothetical protein
MRSLPCSRSSDTRFKRFWVEHLLKVQSPVDDCGSFPSLLLDFFDVISDLFATSCFTRMRSGATAGGLEDFD